jgi:RNA-directed DNA polymerase
MEPRNKRNQDADDVSALGRQYEQGRQTQVPERSCAVIDPEHVEKPIVQELGGLIGARGNAGGTEKANSHKSAPYASEESDTFIVPAKWPNKAAQAGAEVMEGRDVAKGNAVQASTPRAQHRTGVSIGLEGVREAARRNPSQKFTTLLHHINVKLLTESYLHLKKSSAPGIDGVTWTNYQEGFEERIALLHKAVHCGSYRALPSKRSYIPKADGSKRPLGIAALEDKIVQQATATVLLAIYNQDFLGFSYGFRKGFSQHDALDALNVALVKRKVNWILDADIKAFFDTIDHEWMMKFLEHRVADPRILRLVRKWLKAGCIENGVHTNSEMGTPQGAVISPLLSNIYLHYVLDLWAHSWRSRHAMGEVIVTRYADDVVLGFQFEGDAKRFLRDMRQRFAKFALSLHPDKTRLIQFGRYATERRKERGLGKPETFDFLGFTHCCSQTRHREFVVRRFTIKKRMAAWLAKLRIDLKKMRHWSVGTQGRTLRRKVQGYFNYFAVPGNLDRLQGFRREVCRAWRQSLKRRSQKSRLDWGRFARLIDLFIPVVRKQHPYPEERFHARTQGKSRMR